MDTRIIWRNGKFMPEDQAKVSVYDLSQTQGYSVFEMTRSFKGRTFRLREHLERLNASCEMMGIPRPDRQELEYACNEVVRRNTFLPDDEHRLMIVSSPGAPPMYDGLAGAQAKPWTMITDFPLRRTVAGLGKYFDTGMELRRTQVTAIDSSSIPALAKHRSRAHFHRAQMYTPPGSWAVLEDKHGWVTECPGANVMIYKDGVIRYSTYGCLPGISQQYVVEMARDFDIWIQAQRFTLDDVIASQEVWVTGTPFCMLPIVKVAGYTISDGKPGPLYKQFLNYWSGATSVDISEQIKAWDDSRDYSG